jgi:poly(beta-D-mannuronate) lyase
MRLKKNSCLLLLSLLGYYAVATTSVNSIEALHKAVKSARPGDIITLANGMYANVKIKIFAKGTEKEPIIIKAETPGKVFISGKSSLSMAGEYIEIHGLYFTDGYSEGNVIEFRNGKEIATHCRLTHCVIDDYNADHRATENTWIRLYGRHNRIDHNTFSRKLNHGCLLVVELNEERSRQNFHRIEYNIFGHRANLGSNGGETIRVGNALYSLTESNTIITNNYFEYCDGEVEIVSIKAGHNEVSYNTFFESAGVVALRHGNYNHVFNNTFLGNGKAYTGGIRVVNEGHKIHDNYLYKLTGRRFYAALAIMNGVPNSLPNRYHQVKNTDIYNNTWVDCDHLELGTGSDFERTAVPENIQLYDNIFYNKKAQKPFTALDDISGFTFKNNVVNLSDASFQEKGFSHKNISEPKNTTQSVAREKCGASWFSIPHPVNIELSGKITAVPGGQNTLLEAVQSSHPGDILLLTADRYLTDQSIEIDHYLRIEKSSSLKNNPIIQYNGNKGKTAMLTIADGGRLEINGLDFDGSPVDGKSTPWAAIATADKMRGTYSAFISNCSFYTMNEGSSNPFKARPTTMADTLIFENCYFHDLSGDAIFLAAEKEDVGKYNAAYVGITNCRWHKVLGCALNLYRGGNDESTTGPELNMQHCSFDDVNNREQGSVVRLIGVQIVHLDNLSFNDSGRGGCAIRFEERRWDLISIGNCSFNNSGGIKSFFGELNAQKE